MYLRIYPRQNGRNVYIHVGLTKVSIILIHLQPHSSSIDLVAFFVIFFFLIKRFEWMFTTKKKIYYVYNKSQHVVDVASIIKLYNSDEWGFFYRCN